ncbi:ANTAR domain-containing protein [Nakamurella flavida]|uniref:ANTAR domain-containing protein n=1 Tax=Nakamurella flavida TaxID=363630 RepID=A0A939C4F0_9ACTN|nr:ANTAR domain-containing protein [Nakamurella flavida]MBM9475157.1 ANTAR domain-containing protein [Nakamurella flavida]MDP9776726.1 hypothetical protein [Nakamurella flavida]
MGLPRRTQLTDQLDALTVALDGSGDDLPAILAVLVADLTAAISSFSGLVMTVTAGSQPLAVDVMISRVAATSLLLPLRTAPGDRLVLYAQNPGAFVDLAADAERIPGFGTSVVLDRHLPPPTASDSRRLLNDLAERSAVDQAIGFLVDQGYPPGQAHPELLRRATTTGVSITTMARRIVSRPGGPRRPAS